MSVLIDEYGRPIILFDTEDTKKRIKGNEAYKVKFKNIKKPLTNKISKTLWPQEELHQSSKLP